MTNGGLRTFILEEMRARDMSARQFAEFVGVSHTTINKFTDERSSDQTPSLGFLVRLAEATNTDLIALIELVFPGASEMQLSPAAKVLAQRIESLPDEIRIVVESIIRGAPKVR